jgi:hypothetical protein
MEWESRGPAQEMFLPVKYKPWSQEKTTNQQVYKKEDSQPKWPNRGRKPILNPISLAKLLCIATSLSMAS